MDSENANLFEDDEPALNETNPSTEKANLKSTKPHSADSVRDIESWFIESLKSLIPEDMHSIYINENNVLFSCGSLEAEQFDLKLQTECVYEITNRGRRSVLSSFDTLTFYTNLTYRNEAQRKRISLDHMTDPAFLRVIEPRTGKFILSNLIKCANQQQKGLRNYLEFVKKNIFSFPLLEELNRFALSQKLAYRAARQKLWFIMSLAEELKLVELGKVYKKYSDKDTLEFNRNVLDKNVTLRYFKITQKQEHAASQPVNESKQESVLSEFTKSDNGNSQLLLEHESLSSASKTSGDRLVESALVYSQIDPNGIPISASINRFDTNSGYLQDPNQSFTADVTSLNSIPDSNVSVASEGSKPIGFSSLHIGEMGTPQRRHFNFENNHQVDSFDRNFMKFIDDESTPLFQFDNMEGSKTQSNLGETSQTGWKALKMIKKSKIKVEEHKMGHFVQKGLDKFVKKKQSFAFKNAVTTISVLEAACKLYGKGPKWSNPNMKEFDLSNKTKKLVYVKPSKLVKQADLTYQYMLQYASVHQKLNGGVRQEHAVQYGIIEVNKPTETEPRSYKVNTEPWNLEKFEKKWVKLAGAINFSPWLIPKFNDLKTKEQPVESKSLVSEQTAPIETKTDAKLDDGHLVSKEPTANAIEPDASVERDSQQTSSVRHDRSDYGSELQATNDSRPTSSASQSLELPGPEQSQLYGDTQIVPGSFEDTQTLKIKSESPETTLESAHTSSTALDLEEDTAVETQVGEYKNDTSVDKTEFTELQQDQSISSQHQSALSQQQSGLSQQQSGLSQQQTVLSQHQTVSSGNQNKPTNLTGPDGKQMKLTELFKYVYNKINKAKDLPEFPELKLINRFNPVVKQELENFSHIDKQVQINAKRRKVLDDEYAEPIPSDYVKIGHKRGPSEVSESLIDSEDEDYKSADFVEAKSLGTTKETMEVNNNDKEGGDLELSGKSGTETIDKQSKSEDKAKKNNQTKGPKLSKKEKILRMREIMKSMIEFEAIESEDENLSDPEEIKRSLELLKDKLMNPSETESDIESETEIAKEMKDFIGEVEINEEDEEIARLRFNEDQMLADDAELKKVMAFKEKGELELTRREERLRMLEEMKKSQKSDGYHLSDFESSDEETGATKRIRVKVTGEDIDRLLKFKQTQKQMSKQEQLEQFIDYKLTEANIKLPSVEQVPVSTSFIEVTKVTHTHEPVSKLKRRRDMVDNMFNEGLDSIFSNIDEYRSDSSFTVNPFGTPNRIQDKIDNSSSKSPKKPALVMKSFRWDHSQAKPGNTTTVRNFRGFTGFHNLPSSLVKENERNK